MHTQPNLSGSLEVEDAMGHLWFASERGPQRYNDTLKPISYTASSSLENDKIHTIFEAIDGKLWFGHDNGVTAFDPRPVISTLAGIGTNRVRMIYEDRRGYLWFSIPGGVARYNPSADTENITINSFRLGLTQDAPSSTQTNATNRQQAGFGSRTEITKMFEVNEHIWFVNFVDSRSRGRSRRYTFFRYANGKFDQVSIAIQTRIGPGGEGAISNPEVLVSQGQHRWITFGGHLFKADMSGLLRFTNGGFQRIVFGTTSEIDHGEAAITALYRDPNNRLWVHFENGKVLRYPKNIDRLASTTRSIAPEMLPLKATTLLKSALGGKWFFNAVTGKLILWSDTELGGPIPLDGESSSAPLAVWKDPTRQNNQITFLFPDTLRTYLGTQLTTTQNIQLAPVNASLLSKDGILWLATARGAARYDGNEA